MDASTSTNPEFTIHVEALTDEAFYYFGKERGAGGMPVGVGGRVACLLSGGIDSPVAAWRLMRRGCRVHFRSLPQLSDPVARVAGKGARARAKLLARFQLHSRLFLVPFGEIQQQVVLAVAPPLRVVIYRRLMMRIAERIARHGARAGARDRRSRRPGRVADAREPDRRSTASSRCRCCGRSSAWTRTKSSRRRSGSARIRFRSFPTRTAARCSRRGIRRRKARATTWSVPRRRCRSTRSSQRAVAAAEVEDFEFPDIK